MVLLTTLLSLVGTGVLRLMTDARGCGSLLLLVGFLCAAIEAADYYVDPTGGDNANDGSLRAPWRHLKHVASKVQPGDSVYLRKGNYEGR